MNVLRISYTFHFALHTKKINQLQTVRSMMLTMSCLKVIIDSFELCRIFVNRSNISIEFSVVGINFVYFIILFTLINQ